ncbi:hypothetical protein [Archaeoglobus neptunius]|uniref:hypothetical protein n=1 Tax=Archaeoglobus neptunius TaxID=2798580 RepID=UPI0019263598|nr:hypothetical protein [Archaeoglobus neptunius]
MRQWPVKILLVHPKAEFMQDRKLTLAADCAVLINRELGDRFAKETVIIGCPMLEDPKRTFEKIKMIMAESSAEEIDVYTMEVPCCIAMQMMVEKSAGDKKVNRYIVRVGGEVEDYRGFIDERMIEAEKRAHRGH